MKRLYTIGVDIGGTNTDGVLIDEEENIVVVAKTPTTQDVVTGFCNVLVDILDQAGIDSSSIRAVIVGTTHATNAILQKLGLYKVGVVRVAGQNFDSPPPCYSWPEELRNATYAGHVTIAGGFECHGSPITSFCREQAKEGIQKLLKQGAESLAVVGVFAPLNHEHELAVANLVRELAGSDFPVSLSHKISGIGFLERENSTILNASLKKIMGNGFCQLEKSCRVLGLQCPLFITQNNGCMIDLTDAVEYPVLTISAGPTNSFVGASRLAGLKDAIIVDIGGTSTDIGIIRKGQFRRSLNISNIGGVMLNFPMPDVLSMGIGGGSYVDPYSSPIHIGPRSAGASLLTLSKCFGGDCLTLTDVALMYGHLTIPKASTDLIDLEKPLAKEILKDAIRHIEMHIAMMGAEQKDLPVILVGGGSTILPTELLDRRYIVPEHAQVANAYGAALAGVSGVVDTVVSLNQQADVLKTLQEEAMEKAVVQGADKECLEIADLQIIPYHYVPDRMARVIITVTGKKQIMKQQFYTKRNK
ncbi:MAG: hydantoinase/oxoprolinase family protein [Simkania sp.]|nr:hydantoinase/oxoprolinase family protein [Simkania sp.]